MVIFRDDDHVAVVLLDLSAPDLGVLVRELGAVGDHCVFLVSSVSL